MLHSHGIRQVDGGHRVGNGNNKQSEGTAGLQKEARVTTCCYSNVLLLRTTE